MDIDNINKLREFKKRYREYWANIYQDYEKNSYQYLFTQYKTVYKIHELFGIDNNYEYIPFESNKQYFFIKDYGFRFYNHLEYLGVSPLDEINCIQLEPDDYYAIREYYKQLDYQPNIDEIFDIFDIIKNNIF